MPDYQQIPLQATVFSALSIVCFVMMVALVNLVDKELLPGVLPVMILSQSLSTLRAPLTVLITFKSGEALDNRNRSKMRETKRRRELAWAETERTERRRMRRPTAAAEEEEEQEEEESRF